ncbi:MAG: ATP-binding protein, partial [Verrucomicrobia bacterium]|nr:ATP-binding protein [Verrucomicrobiota bacterium]
QVVMNLAVNARDAMPTGGQLSLVTMNRTLDALTARELEGASEGDYIVLEVADTGGGMDAETRRRIFEPFFTTKDVGKGTGLGLSTVYGIVKEAGGAIGVETAVGEGTTFRVFLPASRQRVPDVIVQNPLATLPRGHETILLVEDEPTVARMIRRALEQQGYRVLEAADAFDAQEIEGRFDGTIPLVVTDVVMPRLYGPELVALLRQRRPAIQVLYISGYSGEVLERYPDLVQGENLMPKPLEIPELLRKIDSLLTAGRRQDNSKTMSTVADRSP